MADDSNPVPPPGEMPPGIAPGPAPRPAPETRPREIVLNPRPAVGRTTTARSAEAKTPPENKDSFREVVETIVFVVVLVLLLKTFLAEAFVIPTGSMATTLLGYHREVVCEKCGYHFLVNASKEGDPQESAPQRVISCTCPNCEYTNRLVHGLGGGAP